MNTFVCNRVTGNSLVRIFQSRRVFECRHGWLISILMILTISTPANSDNWNLQRRPSNSQAITKRSIKSMLLSSGELEFYCKDSLLIRGLLHNYSDQVIGDGGNCRLRSPTKITVSPFVTEAFDSSSVTLCGNYKYCFILNAAQFDKFEFSNENQNAAAWTKESVGVVIAGVVAIGLIAFLYNEISNSKTVFMIPDP